MDPNQLRSWLSRSWGHLRRMWTIPWRRRKRSFGNSISIPSAAVYPCTGESSYHSVYQTLQIYVQYTVAVSTAYSLSEVTCRRKLHIYVYHCLILRVQDCGSNQSRVKGDTWPLSVRNLVERIGRHPRESKPKWHWWWWSQKNIKLTFRLEFCFCKSVLVGVGNLWEIIIRNLSPL